MPTFRPCLHFSGSVRSLLIPFFPIHIARVPHPRVDRAIVKLSGTLELCTLSFERWGERQKVEGSWRWTRLLPLDNVELLAGMTKSTHRLRAWERNKTGTNDSRLESRSTTFVNNFALFLFRSTWVARVPKRTSLTNTIYKSSDPRTKLCGIKIWYIKYIARKRKLQNKFHINHQLKICIFFKAMFWIVMLIWILLGLEKYINMTHHCIFHFKYFLIEKYLSIKNLVIKKLLILKTKN